MMELDQEMRERLERLASPRLRDPVQNVISIIILERVELPEDVLREVLLMADRALEAQQETITLLHDMLLIAVDES